MPIRYDQGNCTSRDRNALAAGQLVTSTGGFYAPGDPHRLRKLGGRSTFGTLGAGVAVKGLALCQFDSGGNDRLVGLTGTSLFGATPGVTGTFNAGLATGLSASTTDLSATHYGNRWFLATGYDRNRVLESDNATTGITAVTLTYVENGAGNSDTITRAAGSFVTDGFVAGQQITVAGTALNNGTYTLLTVAALTLTLVKSDDLAAEVIASTITAGVRYMGMIAPQLQPTAVPSTGSVAVGRPTVGANSGTPSWQNLPFAYDLGTDLTEGPLGHFSSVALSAVTGTSAIATWSGLASNTASARVLNVVWSLAGPQNPPGGSAGENPDPGTGGTTDLGATVTILIEYATDWNGTTGTFQTLVSMSQVHAASLARQVSQIPISVNSNLVAVRATFTYNAGTSTVSLRVYDINITTGVVAAFSTTAGGFYYAVTEFDSVRQLESPAGPNSGQIHFTTGDTPSSANIVTLTLNTTAQNTNATHWRIYRTVDGGTVPDGLYLIGQIQIAQTVFVDTFQAYPKDTLGTQFYALVSITIDSGTLRYPRDSAPPRFDFVTFYRGSVVGITHDKPRTLFYSFAGRPESWPELYVLENFPFPYRDVLVAAQPCGDSLVIAGKQSMMCIDDLPRAGLAGTFNAIDIRPIRGQPGVVNQDAMVSYSVNGEPNVAWVSPYGIHTTNGTVSRKISGNMAWPPTSTQAGLSTAQLFYDANRQALVFAYDSSGAGYPDRWALFHMAGEHVGDDGLPKWTGPHYGLINRTVGGIVAGTYRRWTGHPTNGIVYLDDNAATGADSSFAYAGGSDTTWPYIITTGHLYLPDGHEWAVYKANLRFANFAADNLTISWTSGRDSSGSTQTKGKTLVASGQGGADIFVGLQGEWHAVTITHVDVDLGSILDWRFPASEGALAGRVA